MAATADGAEQRYLLRWVATGSVSVVGGGVNGLQSFRLSCVCGLYLTGVLIGSHKIFLTSQEKKHMMFLGLLVVG